MKTDSCPVDRAALIETTAQTIFANTGGDELIDDLASIEGTLLMYKQDVERGLHDEHPEKFRWRVTPAVAQRLRKERKQLRAQLEELVKRSREQAAREVEQMYPLQPAPAPSPETPTLTITQRPATPAEKEAAPRAPVPDAA